MRGLAAAEEVAAAALFLEVQVMVDEKTVMASGPLNVPAGSPAPQTFVQRMAFMWPGLVIALVLAIGVSYWILDTVTKETEAKLAAAKNDLESKNRALGEEIKKVDSANKDLKKDLDDAKAAAAKVDDNLKKLSENLAKTSKLVDDVVALDLSNFMKTSKTEVAGAKEDIKKHEGQIYDLNTKIQYIDKRLKTLDELATDVNGLKSDTTGLKKDYEVLKGDLVSVKKKADITEQDLASLDERARMFQLRVLAARAREAADAARKMDLKALLNRLDDVEDKK